MLEAFRILEEDKGSKKEDIISKPSQNHCVQLIAVVTDNQKVQRLNSMKKLEISVFIRFVKWWMKSLISRLEINEGCLGH